MKKLLATILLTASIPAQSLTLGNPYAVGNSGYDKVVMEIEVLNPLGVTDITWSTYCYQDPVTTGVTLVRTLAKFPQNSVGASYVTQPSLYQYPLTGQVAPGIWQQDISTNTFFPPGKHYVQFDAEGISANIAHINTQPGTQIFANADIRVVSARGCNSTLCNGLTSGSPVIPTGLLFYPAPTTNAGSTSHMVLARLGVAPQVESLGGTTTPNRCIIGETFRVYHTASFPQPTYTELFLGYDINTYMGMTLPFTPTGYSSELWVNVATSLPMTNVGGGTWETLFSIPNDPNLIDLTIYMQAAYQTSGGQIFTRGLHAVRITQ